jgi:DnaJ-class molecular chaperone
MNKKRMLTLVLAGVFALIAVVSVHAATCYACNGWGIINCSVCKGTGKGNAYTQRPDGSRTYVDCSNCGGAGVRTCYTCRGTGQR